MLIEMYALHLPLRFHARHSRPAARTLRIAAQRASAPACERLLTGSHAHHTSRTLTHRLGAVLSACKIRCGYERALPLVHVTIESSAAVAAGYLLCGPSEIICEVGSCTYQAMGHALRPTPVFMTPPMLSLHLPPPGPPGVPHAR